MLIQNIIQDSIKVKHKIIEDKELIKRILDATKLIVEAYQKSKKLLLCGNGGSAADAQHIAAELSGRFQKDRDPLFAEALHVNTSYLTAVANDYSFDVVYQRLVKSFGGEGDVLMAISTSGNSENIIRAVEEAKKGKMFVVGMTGETGGKMKEMCDVIINVPSKSTARIQEAHIMIGHIICEIVEYELFP